jgi:hypothetical protein
MEEVFPVCLMEMALECVLSVGVAAKRKRGKKG